MKALKFKEKRYTSYKAYLVDEKPVLKPKEQFPQWIFKSGKITVTSDGLFWLNPYVRIHPGEWLIRRSWLSIERFMYQSDFDLKYDKVEPISEDEHEWKIREKPKTTYACKITDEFFTENLSLPKELGRSGDIYRDIYSKSGVILGADCPESCDRCNCSYIIFEVGDWFYLDNDGWLNVLPEKPFFMLYE